MEARLSNAGVREYLRQEHGMNISRRVVSKWFKMGKIAATYEKLGDGGIWWTTKLAVDAAVSADIIPGKPGQPRKVKTVPA